MLTEHLAEQNVLDFVVGKLAAEAAARAHVHLDSCDECRAVVALAARELSDPLDREDVTALERPQRRELAHDATVVAAPSDSLLSEARPPLPTERFDEYELLELLGSGGMGAVYRARDTLLDREVAVKLMAPTNVDSARERFLLEARAVARIRHPNVVVVHRVGVVGDQPYIVYDLVRGTTFSSLRKPQPWPRALELAAGIARGLAAAHACGVLHRDLKPANIMIDEQDEVVIVDFGLAKLGGVELAASERAAPAGDGSLTRTGIALGTPRYMAPEAWRGLPATPQTDLYSFGLVMYELLSGRGPHVADEVSQLAALACEQDPPPLLDFAPWVPQPFAAIIDRCIARDPARRPPSAAAVSAELEDLQRGRAFDDFERDRLRRVPPGNPYPGARAFGWEHQGVFFGRSKELRAVIDRLRDQPFVVVTGATGAGKTSLCKAGVLPLVMRGALGGARKWVPVPVELALDRSPIGGLAAALAPHVERTPAGVEHALRHDADPVIAAFRAGHRNGCTAHVLFVDGLEHLLDHRDRADAASAANAIGKLAQPASTLRVLATLDVARMVEVAQLSGLAETIGAALHLVVEPRDETALREIVVEPARLSGRAVDEAVATKLVSAAARGELALGVLEAKLAALWEQLAARQ